MTSSLDSLIGFANLLGQVRGQSSTQTQTTSGGTTTQTSQTDLDQVAIDRMIQQMLAGQGGQKAISGAARGAGLYDSTTERQLLNDLNARVAGEVAQKSAPTTTTTEQEPQVTTTETQIPGIGMGGIGKALGIASAARPALEGLSSMAAGNGSMLTRALGLSPSAPTATQALSADLGNIIAGPNLSSSLGTSLAGIASGLSGVTQAAGTGSSLLGGALGSLDDFATTSFSAALPSSTSGAIGGLGGSLGPLFSVSDPNANAFSVTGSMLSPMLASMGPVGMVAAAVLPILGSLLGGSVVCTALMERGLLDKKLYGAGAKYINTISLRTLKGYYLWGRPLAKQIEKGNKLAIKLSLPFAKQRTALLAGESAWRNPLGVVTKYIGEPACYIIGYVSEKINGFSYSN